MTAIHRLLQSSGMKPEEINGATAAYEQALRMLCVKDRDDPLTEAVVRKIIKVAKTGILEPAQIAARAIEQLAVR